MSREVQDTDTEYIQRFIEKQGRRIKMPTSVFVDAKLHPVYKDHIVVLSKNEFPSSMQISYAWEEDQCDISKMDTDPAMTKYFESALTNVEQENSAAIDDLHKKNKSRKVKSTVSESTSKSDEDILMTPKSDKSVDVKAPQLISDVKLRREETVQENRQNKNVLLKEKTTSQSRDPNVISGSHANSHNVNMNEGLPSLMEECKQVEEGGKRQHSLCERFEVLPDEMKQIVVDTTCDQYLASIEEPSFSYQGYAEDSDTKKKFVHKRFPTQKKKTSEESKNDEYSCDNISYTSHRSYKGFEYRPPIAREKLLLSIWRVDSFGAVKTMERYFTPTNERFGSSDFAGFEISLGLDCETIMLAEKDNPSYITLFVVINPFNLEVMSEQVISIVEDTSEDEHPGIEQVIDMYEGKYLNDINSPKYLNWNKGRYILV